jgi:formylglycine-generating enzyme required for sulfatase activity
MAPFVKRILDHDPAAPPLAMKDPVPMKAPEDAPKEPGMAYVPAGEFIMGSERGEVDEEPRHIVYTDAFFIDIHEVTNAEYDGCVAARKCQKSTTRRRREMNAPAQPVAGVGYKDAVDYCRFAGKRLLTEAEWEKAARGSDERIFPWGNEWHDDFANMAWKKDGFAYTAPVGSFPQGVSPYGVHDLAGNMWEWTADLYDPDYYRKSPARNPKGPADDGNPKARRVMRGGSWMYDVPFFLTTHNRSPGRPWIRKMWVGIRCGKDAPASAAKRDDPR